MGARTGVYLFDYERYVEQVVPAFRARFPPALHAATLELMASPDLSGPPPGLTDAGVEWELLQYLFDRAVSGTCLLRGAYMGNARSAAGYGDCADLPADPGVVTLLELLDHQGRAWTHGSGGFLEGVNGWLDPAQTGALADGLGRLPLPPHEPTWDGVQRARRFDCSETWGCPGRLAGLHAVAVLAEAGGHGLLWGRDLADDAVPMV